MDKKAGSEERKRERERELGSTTKMVAAKLLLTDCSNPITAIKPSSLLNSLFNHRHPAAAFCHSRNFQQHQRSFSTIRASGLNRRDFIADTAAASVALSLAPIIGLDASSSIAKADALSEWERVFLPIDPGVVLLDIAFVPDDPSHGISLFSLSHTQILF